MNIGRKELNKISNLRFILIRRVKKLSMSTSIRTLHTPLRVFITNSLG